MKGAVVHLRASAVPDAAAPFRRGLRLVSSLLLLLLPLLLATPFPTHAADDDDGALLALLKEERNERRLRMTQLMERATRGREPTATTHYWDDRGAYLGTQHVVLTVEE